MKQLGAEEGRTRLICHGEARVYVTRKSPEYQAGPRQGAQVDTWKNVAMTTLPLGFVTFHFNFSLFSHCKTVKCPSFLFLPWCLQGRMSVSISFQRFTKVILKKKKTYIAGLAFVATNTVSMHHKLYPQTWLWQYHLKSSLFMPVEILSRTTTSILVSVTQQQSRASQSKTSHIATKKNFWLLARLFPYQSAWLTSLCFFPFQMLGHLRQLETRSV